jgi:hypothetical protein
MPEKWKDGRMEGWRKNFNLPPFYLLFLITFAFGLRVVKLNDLPLSLSLDEAVDGLDALYLLRLPWFTPFLQNYFGRETLFFYLQGLVLEWGGISIFSFRFASTLAGTLTIPLIYQVGQQLTLTRSTFNLQPSTVSLLAATGLTLSYWHIYFSRVSFRGILLPPLLLGLIWCFWRGWNSQPPPEAGAKLKNLWFIAAGVLLGLTFYTYLPARLLPALFILFVAAEFLRSKSINSPKLLNFLIFKGMAALTALPLALYFQQHPQALNTRTQALSIFAGAAPLTELAGNFLALLQIYFLPNTWLGHWPALDLVSAAGLLLGLLFCLYHVKKPACFFLLLWAGLGTAPVLFSHQDWEATTTLLRGIIAWPALYLIAAIGLTAAGQQIHPWLTQKIKIHYSLFTIPLLLFLLLCSGFTNIYNYFFVWATTYNNFSDHPPRIAQYLNRQTNQLTLIPMKFYGETVANFLLQAQYPTLRNIDGLALHSLLDSLQPAVYLLPNESTAEAAFVLLAPIPNGQGRAYLLPPLTPPQIEALSQQTRQTAPLTTILDGEQEPIAQVYPLTAAAPFLPDWHKTLPAQPIGANFKDEIFLISYQVEPASLKPGQTVTLFLNWQAQQPLDSDYYLFIHLFDVGQRQRWGQVNMPLSGILFNAHRWPAGLTVPDLHSFTLPANAPDGPYRFEVGLYYDASEQRLPVTLNPAASADDKLILGKFHVWRQPPPPPQHLLADIRFGDNIRLSGVDLPAPTLHVGHTLTYTLHWQAMAAIPKNYTVFTHLLDAAGNLAAQQDSPPWQGRYPTSWWDPGEIILDPYTLPLPPNLAPGLYTLRVGLYEPETGRRLPLKNGGADFVDFPNSIKLQN